MIIVEAINYARVYLILVALNINQYYFGSSTALNLQTVREKKPNNLSNRSCHIPALSLDKIITYNCGGRESLSCGTTDGIAPRGTKATIKCKPNYQFESEASVSSTCTSNGWEPPIVDCYKKCEKLNPLNVDLQCFRGDESITCDENTLLAGSKVYPKCKALHFYDEIVSSFPEMTCDRDGKWDKSLFSCVPECGKPNKNYTATEQGRNKARFSDSPWHVAIYNANKVLICGGTIISPYLVLSAAQCFQEEGITSNNTDDYEVVVSKVSKNYTTKDNDYQKTFKIKEIRFSPKGYFGRTNYFAADIAALVLNEKITSNRAVMPACVDWSDTYTGKQSSDNTPAKATGWRLNERPSFDEKLRTLDLSYISRIRCLDLVPGDFIPYITFDKFCASTINGPALSEGFGGSGLLFQKDSSYYVRGIASVTPVTSSNLTTFTDLADHMQWILALRNEIENKNTRTTPSKKPISELSGEDICRSYFASNCVKIQDCQITQHLVETEQATFCGHDDDNEEMICCMDSWASQLSNTNAKPQNKDPLQTQPSLTQTIPQNKNPEPGHSVVTNTKPQNKDPSSGQPSFTYIPGQSIFIYTPSLNRDPLLGNPFITYTDPQIKDPLQGDPFISNTDPWPEYTFAVKTKPQNKDLLPDNPLISNTNPLNKNSSRGHSSVVTTDPSIGTTNMKNSTAIALSHCEKYSQHATDCIYNESFEGRAEKAQLKEFPHIAFIAMGDRIRSIHKWTCVGSLISETFILSSTACKKSSKGDTMWALLGHLSIDLTYDDIGDLHHIEASYDHPDHRYNQIANDIALYKLRNRVEITPYVRPACLYISNLNQIDNKLQTASWETSAINKPRLRAELMKSSLTVVDDSKCSTRFNDLQYSYNPNAMVCVGNLSDGDTLSITAAGSPLLISTDDNNCIWSIFATSTRKNYNKECVYIKVPHYLDWIQSIVWPNG